MAARGCPRFPNGYVVAAIIGRRGGLEAREFLKDALDRNAGKVVSIIADYIENVAEG